MGVCRRGWAWMLVAAGAGLAGGAWRQPDQHVAVPEEPLPGEPDAATPEASPPEAADAAQARSVNDHDENLPAPVRVEAVGTPGVRVAVPDRDAAPANDPARHQTGDDMATDPAERYSLIAAIQRHDPALPPGQPAADY